MSTICFTVGAGVNYKRIFFLLAVDKKVMSCVLPRGGDILWWLKSVDTFLFLIPADAVLVKE